MTLDDDEHGYTIYRLKEPLEPGAAVEITAATYAERRDGTFLVRLEVEAHKLRADGDGTESEIPIDDWIDVAVFGEGDQGGEAATLLFLEKRRIRAARVALEIVVDRRPVRAEIDPYSKLIDRDSGDNVRAVSAADDLRILQVFQGSRPTRPRHGYGTSRSELVGDAIVAPLTWTKGAGPC